MYHRIIKIAWRIPGAGMIGLVLYVLAVSYNLFGLFGPMPDYEALENPKSDLASELISSDGVVLGKYFRANRSPVHYNEISPNVIKALIATEDIRFEKHSGIDFKGTLAIPLYLLMGDSRGSSTLSQQLAKNLFSTRTAKYQGALSRLPLIGKVIAKTKEWILAIRLERAYTKDEIITMYLNTVDFGNMAFGIKVAARTYFNTSSDSLSIPQAALLIGMLKGPSVYNPYNHPERAIRRRNTVLAQMEKYELLSEEQFEKLKQEELHVSSRKLIESHDSGLATYLRAVLQKKLEDWCDSTGYDLYADGLKIYTTIDSRMQRYAEEAMAAQMKSLQRTFFAHWRGRNPWIDASGREVPGFLDKAIEASERYKQLKSIHGDKDYLIRREMSKPVRMRVFSWDAPGLEKDTTMSPIDSISYYKHFLRTGMMSMDPQTGYVKAWVGGINYKYFKYDHVMQGKRQPGSTFKPIVYAAALELFNGKYTPCTEFSDVPQTVRLSDGRTWTPGNSGGYSGNTYTLRQAMARSINTAAVFLMKDLSPGNVVEYARKLGVKSPLEEVPALALGISDVSLYEMVGVYSAFVNQGTWNEPQYLIRIEDKGGKTLYTHIPESREVMNEQTAYTMTYMLRGATEEDGGTARGLFRYGFMAGNQVGGKTGTTNNNADGWFICISPNLVTGAWVGGEDRSIHFRTTDLGSGSRMALPTVGMYMDKVFSDVMLRYKKGLFPVPENFNQEILNCKGGTPADELAPGDTTNYEVPDVQLDDLN